jgi:hypothetical protein
MREHDYVFFTSYNGQYFQKQQTGTANGIIILMVWGADKMISLELSHL